MTIDEHAALVKAELKALAESIKRGIGQRVRWQMYEWQREREKR